MGEGKREGKSGDGVLEDPLIEAFAEFATSEAFGEEVNAFFRDNCDTFASATFEDDRKNITEGEQRLEWTALHRDYLELVESKLGVFCEEHGTTPEDMFAKIEEVAQSSFAEFVPQFITNTDYVYFATQMNAIADEKASTEKAVQASNDNSEFNLSGVWKPDGNTDTSQIKKFVKHNNVSIFFAGFA